MKSRKVKWGLAVAILLLLLWWLLRFLGPNGQPSPAGNAPPLSNTEPAVPLPLSNVPQGVLGPPSHQQQEQQEQAEETETPAPAPAPVLFPLKNAGAPSAPKRPVTKMKTALIPLNGLSEEEKHQIRITLKTQPALIPSLMNLLAVNGKGAALAAAHYNSLSPQEKHQIGVALKTQPLLGEKLTELLAMDGKQAALGASQFNNRPSAAPGPLSNVPQGVSGPPSHQEQEQTGAALEASHFNKPPSAVPGPLSNVPQGVPGRPSHQKQEQTGAATPAAKPPTVKTILAHAKMLSSEEKHLIRLTMQAQPSLAPGLASLLSVNPKRTAMAATNFSRLSAADKHQIGVALKAQPIFATRLAHLLAVDGQRAVRGASHFNSLPSADKNRIDQTLKAQPGLTENLAKLILEPSRIATSLSTQQTHGKKRHGGLDYEMEWWGYRSGVTTEQTIVIKDDDGWDQFRTGFPMPPGWTPEKDALDARLRRPPPVLPDVNFDKMMVIGVFLGKVQEGYRIAISTTTVSADGKTMNVNYGKTFPLPNPMEGTALNEPYDIMVVKRFDGDVYFWDKP